MKKIFLLTVLITLPFIASAEIVEINGLWYDLTLKAKLAKVTYNPDKESKYKGNIAIPSTITFDGIECSVIEIGEWAFTNCSELTSITIPESVITISDYAFQGCSGLSSLHIPELVSSIGYSAFSGCGHLNSITVDGNNKYYDSRNECNAIIQSTWNELIRGGINTIIPNSVTSIGDYAFSGCNNLTEITIPNNVTFIGYQAFGRCDNIQSLTIPSSVNTINDHGIDMGEIKELVIEEGVSYIGSWNFMGCTYLTSLIIPNSVNFIGSLSFSSSGISSLSIGSNVNEIADFAFAWMMNLSDTYCYATEPPSTDLTAFSSSKDNSVLHVPSASLDAYKSTAPWSGFKEIVPIEETGIKVIEKENNIKSIYTIDGLQHQQMQKGINILISREGNRKKVIIK